MNLKSLLKPFLESRPEIEFLGLINQKNLKSGNSYSLEELIAAFYNENSGPVTQITHHEWHGLLGEKWHQVVARGIDPRIYGVSLSQDKNSAIMTAFMECIERHIFYREIVKYLNFNYREIFKKHDYTILDQNGLLRKATLEDLKQYLLTTNGCAAHFDQKSAALASFREVVERHTVLTSVFLDQKIQEIVIEKYKNLPVKFYRFPSSEDHQLHVTGCCIHERERRYWGFGVSNNISQSTLKAYKESLLIFEGFKGTTSVSRAKFEPNHMKHIKAYYENQQQGLYQPKAFSQIALESFTDFEVTQQAFESNKYYTWKIKNKGCELFITVFKNEIYQDLFFSDEIALIKTIPQHNRKLRYMMHPIS